MTGGEVVLLAQNVARELQAFPGVASAEIQVRNRDAANVSIHLRLEGHSYAGCFHLSHRIRLRSLSAHIRRVLRLHPEVLSFDTHHPRRLYDEASWRRPVLGYSREYSEVRLRLGGAGPSKSEGYGRGGASKGRGEALVPSCP